MQVLAECIMGKGKPLSPCFKAGIVLWFLGTAKLKKTGRTSPNDSRLRTLSVVPIWLMILHLEHCHIGSVYFKTHNENRAGLWGTFVRNHFEFRVVKDVVK